MFWHKWTKNYESSNALQVNVYCEGEDLNVLYPVQRRYEVVIVNKQIQCSPTEHQRLGTREKFEGYRSRYYLNV